LTFEGKKSTPVLKFSVYNVVTLRAAFHAVLACQFLPQATSGPFGNNLHRTTTILRLLWVFSVASVKCWGEYLKLATNTSLHIPFN